MGAKDSDGTVETHVRELELHPDVGERAVPSIDAFLAVVDVVLAQGDVQGTERRYLPAPDDGVDDLGYNAVRVAQTMVVAPTFLLASPSSKKAPQWWEPD